MQIKVTNTLTNEAEIVEADGFEGNMTFRKSGMGTQFTQYPEAYKLEEIAEDEQEWE